MMKSETESMQHDMHALYHFSSLLSHISLMICLFLVQHPDDLVQHKMTKHKPVNGQDRKVKETTIVKFRCRHVCVFISNSFVSFYETSAISLAIDPKNGMIIGVSILRWKIVVFRTLNERSVKTFA